MMRGDLLAIGIVSLGLAACSGGPKAAPEMSRPPVRVASSETDAAFDLLMAGQVGQAQKKIKSILKRDPGNVTANVLQESIDRDPQELLGTQSYPYVARRGDTIVSLSQRFLGNRLKAYQFARYNRLASNAPLSPGQNLRIPGQPPAPPPVRHAEPPAARKPEPTARPATAPKSTSAVPAPRSVSPADLRASRAARTAGLSALNQGRIGQAVVLLRRASTLDPGNPLIKRDLARAERIAGSLGKHP